jgi:hypothetical protein
VSGVELIAAERRRQISVEGWTPEHDDEHEDSSLAMAAVCYAADRPIFEREEWTGGVQFGDPWPWGPAWDKRPRDRKGDLCEARTTKQRIRNLVKAGALIAAEIDRLQRA